MKGGFARALVNSVVKEHVLKLRQKGGFTSFGVAILVAVFLLSCLTAMRSANSQPNTGAYFTSVEVTNGIGSKELINGGAAEVYYGENPVYVNLTLYNVNCSMASGPFLVEAVAVLTGHAWESGNVSIAEGTNGTIVFNLCNLTCEACVQATGKNITDSIWSSEPGKQFVFTFRLYYYGPGGRVLEDEETLNLQAVENFIGVSQNVCKIGKGQSGTLELSVTDLDDEPISAVNITFTGSNGFEFSPNATDLYEISGSATKAATVDVKVPDNLETGSYNVTFHVDYTDFSGEVHVEARTASINVEPVNVEPASGTSMIYYFTTAAAVVVLVALLVVYKRRASKKREQGGVRKVS
jgi:hypothetical protein